jgi:hypothetical protein
MEPADAFLDGTILDGQACVLAQVFRSGRGQSHLHAAAWMGDVVDAIPAAGPVAQANVPESAHCCKRVPSDLVI